ncbi:MAG: hypothetical protein ACOX6I_06435, partial [Syntrophomonadaceae bacterium]
FHRQLGLYQTMYELSGQQQSILRSTGTGKAEQVRQVLSARQELIKEISDLNQANIQLRRQVKQHLGIDEFVFSQLETRIDPSQFQQLRQVIAGIERILKAIMITDNWNEAAMRKDAASRQQLASRGTQNQAAQAYNEHKNYKKE